MTHQEIVKRYSVPGECRIEPAPWPYECVAKDRHPNHAVYVCREHSVWWHTASKCPNCGSDKTPRHVVACAERISFYNCANCDFSTWDLNEYSV